MGTEVGMAAIAMTCEFGVKIPTLDFAGFVASRPEEFRPLYVGPIIALTNGYVSYALMSSGSRYGYETYHDHQREMQAFKEFMLDAGADVVMLEFGSDFRTGFDPDRNALSVMYAEQWKPDLPESDDNA